MSGGPRVDGGRLWRTLEEFSAFGAIPGGGLTRLALSAEDRLARDRLCAEARGRGYKVSVDPIGNILILRPGEDAGLPIALALSHLDSQPRGGRYDGAYGVLAGLEALRALDDHGVRTRRGVGVADFTNEEGARFSPALTGSSVISGSLGLEEALGLRDAQGARLGDELTSIGYRGEGPLWGPGGVHAAFELHIEQGPVLEGEGTPLGAVTGIFGISWQEVRFLGPGGHSGTVPVARRRDPALALARLVEAVNRLGLEGGEDARATVGRLSVSPGSINSIASEAVAYVEFRSPDPQGLKSLESSLSEAVRGIAGGLSLGFGTEGIFRQEPVAFDPGAVRAVERAAGILGLGCRRMASGAGHDAGKLAGLAPTAMIFIPCHGGLSHVPQEGITAKWAEDGANALLLCLLEKAMG